MGLVTDYRQVLSSALVALGHDIELIVTYLFYG